MNIIERTIYIGLIVLMVAVIATNYLFDTKTPGPWPKPQTESPEQSQPVQDKPTEIEYSALFTLGINNGYEIRYDAKNEPLVISKETGRNNFVEIEIASTGEYYGNYMNGIHRANGEIPTLYDGPNGWKYYKNKSWISTPSPKITQEGGNVSKVFLKEICDNVFTVTQNDYTGGKYDKEIEKLISKIELYGRHW